MLGALHQPVLLPWMGSKSKLKASNNQVAARSLTTLATTRSGMSWSCLPTPSPAVQMQVVWGGAARCSGAGTEETHSNAPWQQAPLLCRAACLSLEALASGHRERR